MKQNIRKHKLNRTPKTIGTVENKATVKGKEKGKEEYLYSAFLHQGTLKALRRGSHSFTCKAHIRESNQTTSSYNTGRLKLGL